MNKTVFLLLGILVTALTTYLLRALPVVALRRPVRSAFLRSFLAYTPYAVLAAMTLPDIFSSTASPVSAAVGFCVAVGLGLCRRSLLTVAAASAAAVFLVERLLPLLG